MLFFFILNTTKKQQLQREDLTTLLHDVLACQNSIWWKEKKDKREAQTRNFQKYTENWVKFGLKIISPSRRKSSAFACPLQKLFNGNHQFFNQGFSLIRGNSESVQLFHALKANPLSDEPQPNPNVAVSVIQYKCLTKYCEPSSLVLVHTKQHLFS